MIVEHPPQALEHAPQYRVSRPIATIGGPDADSAHDATMLRAAVFVGGGRFIALDNRAAQLRLFDSNGATIAVYGRRGEGPGEFRGPSDPHLGRGNSIWLFDARRLVRLSAELKLVGAYPISGEMPFFGDWALPLGDTAALGIGERTGDFKSVGDPPRRARASLVRVGPDRRDTITFWLGATWYPIESQESGQKFIGEDGFEFGGELVISAWRGGIAVGNNDSWSFEVRDADGALRRRITLHQPPRPVTAAMRDSVIIRLRRELDRWTGSEGDKHVAYAGLSQRRFADAVAWYTDFLPARDGSLWVAEYVVPTDTARWYAVFDAEGRLTHRVQLPAGHQLLAADDDLVIVRRLDAEDIGYLDLARIVPVKP